eukprot:359666-Chlamydomonas_euryale.AAC.1
MRRTLPVPNSTAARRPHTLPAAARPPAAPPPFRASRCPAPGSPRPPPRRLGQPAHPCQERLRARPPL